MTPVTPAQFFAILVFVAMVLGINFGFWRWANRQRHDRLTLAVEDQTPDEQPIIVADYGRMAALPEALYEDLFDHLDRRRRWTTAPNDTWQPARPNDTPGALVPGEGDIEPQPTLREQRIVVPEVTA